MENPHLDTRRHMEVFKAEEFDTPIHIIGAGATGSWLALCLAKLGISGEQITVWDFDTVEAHNVPNQAFYLDDISVHKVEALYKQVKLATGTEIKTKIKRFEGGRLSGIVFLMVDSMAGRKKIWEESVRMKFSVKHLIEPRMGLDGGRIYNVDPMNLEHIKKYEDTFYSDEEAEVSACGTSMTVITTAMSIASMCARQLINYHNGIELDNEILIDLLYNNFINTRW